MKPNSLQTDVTPDDRETPIRRWTAIKKIAGLVVVFGILLGGAGTAIAMVATFKNAAEDRQPIPVDSLASSIESSLHLGMWLSPIIIGFAVLWFVARARLRTLYHSQSWPNQIAG